MTTSEHPTTCTQDTDCRGPVIAYDAEAGETTCRAHAAKFAAGAADFRDLPRTQGKALVTLFRLFAGQAVSEFDWRTGGAGTAAITQLVRRGLVACTYAPFVMPVGPYKGQTMNQPWYTPALAN